ncbi:peptide ABC transporter substrate-binding protein [Rhodobacteraceae bacterium M382]|nr:peptide ABC transporter substrate-binding protein [Rhodobacteraceae bacterium M382]
MTRIDRRALFTSGAAAALLAATGTSVTAAPRRGGVLRLAVPRDGDMLESVARGAVYDTLTEIGPDGVLKGELATSWRSSPDARVWHFQLRDEVPFHDGAMLNAEDVAASLRAHDFPDGCLGIKVIGTTQLQLELVKPNSDLPYLLADPKLIIARAGQIGAPLNAAIGTGVYQVSQAQDGRHFSATRLAQHFKDGQAGWVDRVEVITIPDASVRAEALRDGYVDIAALPEPKGLLHRGEFTYHPSAHDMALATHAGVGLPRRIGARAPMDDGRIVQRWWVA